MNYFKEFITKAVSATQSFISDPFTAKNVERLKRWVAEMAPIALGMVGIAMVLPSIVTGIINITGFTLAGVVAG